MFFKDLLLLVEDRPVHVVIELQIDQLYLTESDNSSSEVRHSSMLCHHTSTKDGMPVVH